MIIVLISPLQFIFSDSILEDTGRSTSQLSSHNRLHVVEAWSEEQRNKSNNDLYEGFSHEMNQCYPWKPSNSTDDETSTRKPDEGQNSDQMSEFHSEDRYTEFSITVTGAALDVILKKRKLLVAFYRLARRAAVVIACRVTPKQKSLLVKQNTALNPTCSSSVAIGQYMCDAIF